MTSAKKSYRVLIIDDDSSVRSVLQSRLERKGHEVEMAEDGAQALEKAQSFQPLVAVSDIRMPGLDGFEVLSELKVPTILITGHGDKESAIRAVESGAFAFFEKPFDLDALEVAIVRGAERRLMEIERQELLQKLDRLCKLQNREIESLGSQKDSHFVGESESVAQVKEILQRLALKPHATLLLQGETGTGKEVAARELHRLTHKDSHRVPFLALNCAAIPTELLESELYGHEKGSFSGAQTTRIGLAEAAREGTLFLDEIGDMDPRHQAKLLRLLQERKFRRVGSNLELPFTGRIIAATHRDLKALSAVEKFREDLYYRLSVVAVELPPLRRRGADLLLLAESLCQKHGLKGIRPERVAEMRSYPWPGNIRELNNWIERAAILGDHDDKGYLKAELPRAAAVAPAREQASAHSAAPSVDTPVEGRTIKELRAEILDSYDRQWIVEALERHRGNISAAAKDLGLDRKNLAKRMKDLGLDASTKKAA